MRRLVFGLATLAACVALSDAAGQQPPPPGLPSPRLSNVFPAGAKAGSTPHVTKVFGLNVAHTQGVVTVGGFDLDEPTGLLFSHPGIKGEYIQPNEPPEPKKDAQKGKRKSAAAAGPHHFAVSVAKDVPPGTYDVRVVSKWGVSNPRAFVVGELPEVNEKEPNNDVPEAQRIEVGTTVNGVIGSGTDVDYTVFAGKKGQRVVISCLASSLDSRARPMIEVYAADGRKLAQNRNHKDTDAVVDLTVPADGDYYVRLFEFTYQSGSPDHTYRLTIASAPWIDAVFPPAVEPGKPAQVTLYGRNLPGGKPAAGLTLDGRPLESLTVTVTPPTDPKAAQRLAVRDRIESSMGLLDGFEYRLKGPGGPSNPVPIFFARDKVVVQQKRGGTRPETAEPIPAPCEVAGMFHRKGERDWYSFEAKKGDVLTVELLGERIGSTADFYLSVHDPANKNAMLGGEQDDDNDSLHPFGFYTRTADPAPYKFTAPADGKYLVAVGARETGFLFGPRTIYRLRVSTAKPDFRVVAMPYSRFFQTGSAARQDGSEAYDVYVHRIDGFNAAVTVTAEGLPAGVTAKPVTIGPNARWGTLVLSIGPSAAAHTGPIKLTAKSELAGKAVTREVRPASITWGVQPGQNVPVLARLDQSLVLAVRPEKGFFKLAAETEKATVKVNGKDEKLPAPLTVKQGEKITLPVKVTWVDPEKQGVTVAAEPMAASPQQSPITVQPGMQPTKDKPEGVVTVDVKSTAPPGKYTVSLRGDAQVPFVRDPVSKQKANVPTSAFADPVEITVIPSSVAKVTPGQLPNNTLKLGQTGELSVKVDRQYDFAGEFQVKFVAPMGVTGVTAEDVTIPAGKNETNLVIEAGDDAKPGPVNNATVVVTAVYGGKHTVTHEVKVTFTVAK
jgi:hypothetical protein